MTEYPEHRRLGTAPMTAADQRTLGVPEKDRVLFAYRTAARALRHGDLVTAREMLDDAISRIGGIITKSEDAARARSLWHAESTKRFIGEPYERVMAYYYRGILYWRDGETDNARACFRSGQVIDGDPNSTGHYDADYVLLDYLDGLATAKLGGDGEDARARAQQNAGDTLLLPPYEPAANVLVFAEFGYGPRKYATGRYGEQLRFHTDDSPSRAARLVLDGTGPVPLPAYDDLGYQATTRGGRVMDHILGNKAQFKTGAAVAGDIALAGSAVAQEQARHREREGRDPDNARHAAFGLGVLGVIGKVASAAADPRADTRQWDNLPQRLSFAALSLAPGQHRGRIEFLDGEGNILEARTQQITFSVPPNGGDTVLFLSELKG